MDSRFAVTLMPLVAALSLAAAPAAGKPAWNEAGRGGVWRYAYYGDAVFAYRAGEAVYSNAMFAVDLRLLKWPDRGSGRGFLRQDWSFCARSTPTFGRAGEYRFRVTDFNGRKDCGIVSGVDCRVAVDGRDLSEREGGVELAAGRHLVEVFGRHKFNDNGMGAGFMVEWKEPGETEWKLFKPEAADDSAMALDAVRFDRDLRFKDGFNRLSCHRSWKIAVEEDGLYEFVYHANTNPYDLQMRLDSVQIMNWHNTAKSRWLELLRGGACKVERDRYTAPVDWYGRAGTKFFLAKGEHVLDVMLNWRGGVGDVEKRMDRDGSMTRLGLVKLDGRNPKRETAFFPENRDTAVLDRGETLDVTAMASTDGAGEFTFEVLKTRGRDVIHSQKLRLGRSKGHFTFTPTEEAGYEYRVRNAAGEIVDGPWTFCMFDPTPVKRPKMTGERDLETKGVTVDSFECTEEKGGPHDLRDSGTSKVVTANGYTYRLVGPQGPKSFPNYEVGKTPTGLPIWKRPAPGEKLKGFNRGSQYWDWFCYTLHPKHPGRPHVVRCRVPNDRFVCHSVQVIDPRTWQSEEGCYVTGLGPASPKVSNFDMVTWPNGTDLYVLVNHSHAYHNSKANRQSAVIGIDLIELPDDLPPLPEPANGWARGRDFGCTGEQGDIWVMERTMPPLFDDWDKETMVPTGVSHYRRRWDDFMITFERFMRYSAWRGDSEISVPTLTYNMLFADTESLWEVGGGYDVYTRGPYDENTDRFYRDLFKIMLMKANKYGIRLIADFTRSPSDADAAAWAVSQGLDVSATNHVFLSRVAGEDPWKFPGPRLMNPAHPVFRRQMVKFCGEFGRRYGKYDAFGGIRFRFWDGCTAGFEPYFYDEGLGLDDFTVSQFCKDTGVELEPVGTDAGKFEARKAKLLSKELRDRWFAWRTKICRTQVEDMLKAMREGAPQARFIGPETPPAGWREYNAYERKLAHDGIIPKSHYFWKPSAGLAPEAFRGREELGFRDGFCKLHYPGCEMCRVDNAFFAEVNRRPAPYTNASPVHAIYQLPSNCAGGAYRAEPYQMAAAAEALAKNELNVLWTGVDWAIAPMDRGLRKFVQRWRSIPRLDYRRTDLPGGDWANVAVWSAKDADGNLVVWFVNRTEYEQRLEVTLADRAWEIVNLTDGETLHGRKAFTRKLPPFMLEAWKVMKATEVAGAKLEVSDAEKAYVERLFKDVTAMEKYAKGVEERVTAMQGFANAEWSDSLMPDRVYTFEGLVNPIREAIAKDDWVTAGALVRRFNRERTWWYEAFGWPEGMPCDRKVGGLVGLAHSLQYAKLPKGGIVNTNEARVVKLMYSAEGYARSDVGKPLVLRNWIGSGRTRLEMSALFGGPEYGDLRIETNGHYFATVPCGPGATTRDETRIVPVPLVREADDCKDLPFDVAFIPEPGKRVAIRRLESVMYEPEVAEDFLVAVADGKAADDPSLTWKKVSVKPGARRIDLAAVAGGEEKGVEARRCYVKVKVDSHNRMGGMCLYVHGEHECRWTNQAKFGPVKVTPKGNGYESPRPGWCRGAVQFRPGFRAGKPDWFLFEVRPKAEGPYTFGFGARSNANFDYGIE